MARMSQMGAAIQTVMHLKDWAGARRRRQSTIIMREQEMKERVMAMAKGQRQERRDRLTVEHRHVMKVAAHHLGVPDEDVEEGVLDADTHVALLESFLSAGGRSLLVFATARLETLPSDSGRDLPESLEGLRRVVVVSGNDIKVKGLTVAVFRVTNDKDIDMKHILEDIYFKSVVLEEEVTCIALVEVIASLVTKARLAVTTDWGQLDQSTSGVKAKEEFLNTFHDFTVFLEATKKNLKEVVTLESSDLLLRTYLTRPDRILQGLVLPAVVKETEDTVTRWHNQITFALLRTSRMRRDWVDAGPDRELSHWRFVSAVLTSIVEQIKRTPVKYYIRFLIACKSKLFQKWKDLDNRVTNAYNEALDNVKFLYSLETLYLPLYASEPSVIQKSVRVLMFGIRMMYTTSLHFNTREKITSLFTKVTARMVTTCSAYLTRDGDIWKQAKHDVIRKINECMELYKTYNECFEDTCKEMEESPHEKPFNCSRKYIFRVFEVFDERLLKISDVLSIVLNYSLLETCAIENVDRYAQKFSKLFVKISTKPYNVLEYFEPDFNSDYDEFKRHVSDIEVELQAFLAECLKNEQEVVNALGLLQRFENLNLPCFKIASMYPYIVEVFEKEIAKWRDFYDEHCPKPHLHNMPPTCGRIYWARSIFKRIDAPMTLLKAKPGVLEAPGAWRAINMYNALLKCLIYYEMSFHREWCKNVLTVSEDLNEPVLVRTHETHRIHVNFNPALKELIVETENMWELEMEVPEAAMMIALRKERIFHIHTRLQVALERDAALRSSIDHLFLPLLRPLLYKLQRAFQPGLQIVTWMSYNIVKFCDDVEKALTEAEIFLKQANDIRENRIDKVREALENVMMASIPSKDEFISASEFADRNIILSKKVGPVMETMSMSIETSVLELIEHFLSLINCPEIQDEIHQWMQGEFVVQEKEALPENAAFYSVMDVSERDLAAVQQDCKELFNHYTVAVLDALTTATKNSLHVLSSQTDIHRQVPLVPMFTTDLELDIPTIVLSPSLEHLQKLFNNVFDNVMNALTYINMWGQPRLPLDDDDTKHTLIILKNYHRTVTEQNEIIALTHMLRRGINQLTPHVGDLTQGYLQRFQHLWAPDRDEQLAAFVNADPPPSLFEINEKYATFEKYATEIRELPPHHDLGAIRILTEKLQQSMLSECDKWHVSLGDLLHRHYNEKLMKFLDKISAKAGLVQRKIADLDAVRILMECLQGLNEEFYENCDLVDHFEEIYNLLQKFGVKIPLEEAEKVDTLRMQLDNMTKLAKTALDELMQVYRPFRQDLLEGVAQFKVDLTDFNTDFHEKGPMEVGIPAQEASDRVLLFKSRFEELQSRYETYHSGEQLFDMEVQEYPLMEDRRRELRLLGWLYDLYNSVMITVSGYFELLWAEVDIEAITAQLQEFQMRCRQLPAAMRDWPAYIDLKKKIDDFNEMMPLLRLMLDKSMKERHWTRLSETMGYNFDVERETFSLRDVMEAPLLKFSAEVEDVCIGAVREKDIEYRLNGVKSDWSAIDLHFAPFKNRGDLLLKGIEISEIMGSLEESLMTLSSLFANRYNVFYKKEIQKWMNMLSSTFEILETWIQVQNLWVYLEAVFMAGDIAKQLPNEARRFQMIDRNWVELMRHAREVRNVVTCCVGDETMSKMLPHLLQQLEDCQKSLSGYLESKRLIFPRFFFVSDPVLLEILGQASDSHAIQPHLLSVFDNVARAEFSENEYDRIIAVFSREHEKINLVKDVMCTGGVELWLGELLEVKKQSIGAIIEDAAHFLLEPDFHVLEMMKKYPAQVGLVSLQSLWTRDAEKALSTARTNRNIMKLTNRHFLNLLNLFIEQTVKDLTPFDRTKYETIVTIHLHQRDIFDELVRLRIRSIRSFEWLKQARFYFVEDSEELVVRITDVDFIYQNEYLGCTERLVITPLTDRCYITLAQALGMSMGGAPAGPAGTGKTETTKDMGRALGKYVVVFNCSDQMDFRGLGRIFKGLAQSGSWGCFDEFNRINLPVLSVAAQQISIVLMAKKERKKSFIFLDGDNVSLNPEFGIFLTMNPGYAGRQELPENLKVQFRTVAMMVPDRQIIIRVKLASCGFKDNIALGRKFFVLYALCEEQLSKQVHYDFGLRNILSVLRTLGAQKRANPKDSEEQTVMRVLFEMNLSKLVDEDEPLFRSLINDLFPGMKIGVTEHEGLQGSVAKAIKQKELVNHPAWNLKIVQFYETSLVRHGLMALGPTGAGKTTMIHTLMLTMTDMGQPHKEMRMNPKAITAPQMFGTLDVATNDWTDGIFSTLWRRTHRKKSNEHIWLVLDGPVDAVWIENLNSVLDDNQTLTLANGDRIPMAANCKLLFEPDNVDNASPATVSRMGMVFISSSTLTWHPLLEGWLLHRRSQEATVLRPLFEKIYSDLEEFVNVRLTAKMNTLDAIYIRQCTDILEGVIDVLNAPTVLSDEHLHRLFLFSLMWSLGALLELDDREKWQNFVLNHKSQLDWPKIAENESIFDYMVNKEGEWQHWSEHVQKYSYPVDEVPDYLSILVPNVDNVRMAYLINVITQNKKPVLLIGEQGTAKTVMIKSCLLGYNPEEQISKTLNFSSATTPNMFQRTIESYVDRRAGTTYGPPAGKKMTVFVDDINMPVVNEWGDQITNEIVRQLIETRGFYSLDKPGDFLIIEDMQFVAAMIHPGGGRNDIPSRLKRHFNTFNCTIPSNTSVDFIFSCIGEGYFCKERFKQEIVDFVPKLVPLTRIIWQRTKAKMLPTPAKFHYVFNLRDLSRIWQGMLFIHDEELPDIKMMLKLWVHECTRVISDRFINYDDRDWFRTNMSHTAEEELGDDFEHYPEEETYFVDFLRDPPEATGEEEEAVALEAPKIYEEVPSFEFLISVLHTQMFNYNDAFRIGQMDMVFFFDAIVHIIKISRVMMLPQGHVLLVGVGGSGKQSLTRLASFIAGYSTHQITLSRSYGESELLEDLKVVYNVAGKLGKGMTFIFTDNEIKDEGFLEYINNILGTGEIAGLFSREEFDEIGSTISPIMRKQHPRRAVTPETIYEFFIERSRENLHVALCFSPIGEKFRSRSLKFPGLISGCTMDWFMKWPKDALVAVSRHFLNEFNIISTPEVKNELIELMGDVQEDVSKVCEDYFERFRRQTYVTPKSFLSFLDGYKRIYSDRLANISNSAMRMDMGLEKLVEAQENVDELRKELEAMDKVIKVAVEETRVVMERVSISAQAAEAVKAAVERQMEEAEAMVVKINADNEVATAMLADAMPALQAAIKAADTIKPVDIATVRRLPRPPFLAMVILDAVLIFFRRKVNPAKADFERGFMEPSWAESLKLLADARFVLNLKEYNEQSMNDETVDLLRPYLDYEEYTPEKAMAVSSSIAGLLVWTRAMVDYYAVSKFVRPLQENVERQKAIKKEADERLAQAEMLLKEKQAEMALVQAEYDKAKAQEQEVQAKAQDCQDRMDAAMALLGGLANEQTRWTEQSASFKREIDYLIGDVLLLTGFLSYSGPYNQTFREHLQGTWSQRVRDKGIPTSGRVSIVESLVDSATIGEWNLQELPTDELSIQNGIIVTKASRYPLLIDPQGQGKMWIRNKERDFDLQVTNLQHKYFRTHLEDSLPLGRPVLIEDVGEELDPVLDHLLEKHFIKVGTMYKVMIGDKEVDVHSDFRLYITTKLANPTYTPEVFARTSIIDFTVTIRGLEDQLLGRVILAEKRELEAERTALISGITANKRQMKQLEDALLHKLTTVEGSLLEDKSVINVLNVTKNTALDVQQKLKVAATTEVQINTAREEFRPVATRGSVIYFVIVEMAMVNSMYQTSLTQFLERFDLSLERSEKTIITQTRIRNIIEYMTFEVFRYKCQGLYEEHKYLFTLLMTLKVDMQRNHITHDEFQYLLIGGAALDLATSPPKPFRWISDVIWLNLLQLQTFSSFENIVDQLTKGEKTWRAWYDKEAPEEAVFPDGYSSSVDVFRQLMLIRAWSTDRILFQARKYVAASLGPRYNLPVITDYDRMVAESRPAAPMIGFLSMGSDPTQNIMDMAKRSEVKCSAISMGQGQEVHSRKLLSFCMLEGGWVLLQNAHLGLEYMDELFVVLTETEKLHPDLRVWITTEPHPAFSISLLQICTKFTNDPPQGMRAGLRRTYGSMTDNFLEYSSLPEYLPLVYTTSFLHSVVQERRKFGPLGWNIPYEFNSSDWLASCLFIQNHLDDMGKVGISWTTVRYMLGEVQYGGRVTDDFDKRLLVTFAKNWYNDDLFGEKFEFYDGYKILVHKTVEEYLQGIDQLPDIDPPQVYGLHPNADITYQSNTTKAILDKILSVQPRESASGTGETRESVVNRQAEEMLSKLPSLYDPFAVRERLRIMNHLLPMNIFLKQEIERMDRVIRLVGKTLRDLILAIEGTIIMSEQLRDALDNIFNARVPSLWQRVSWASSTIGFWYTELLNRNTQFSTWIFGGRPKVFWMTGFFNPQGFLTAMRQEMARASGWSLDTVTLQNKITKLAREEVRSLPKVGVYVYGLFLDGAAWDKKKDHLIESTPKILFVALPIINIYAISSIMPPDPNLYVCPVYKKPRRTDLTYITKLFLPTEKSPDHWIMRGVAILCDTK
ncbi:dynein axonemal heavy chain 8-like [Bacillus rossius redtenbacheri]|uniref:dynein axonemal heavy chain 8-like n=1 Tax=Bacillus rossius redtenbacheri TaxID=93214 RepID=UPI002FDE40EF